MSIQNQLIGAVQESMQDAMQAAERSWKQSPSLYSTAALTGTNFNNPFDSVEAEIAFETHTGKIPIRTRDMNGVAGRTVAARPRRYLSHAGSQTLMQKMQDTLTATFEESVDTHLRQI